ncbi:MAG: HipA family kinase [Verrucomicrobiota bacterium]
MAASLVSICGRAERGLSRPFFCEADDGHFYYVKKDNLSRDRLLIEFVIGRLAEECGLPVAPLTLVEVPESLVRHAVVERIDELTAGIAFGSQRVPYADELRNSHLRQVDDEVKMRCLCFDWWVKNPDRRLDLVGGDPNLLWDPVLQQVAMIDHDGALDPDFDETEFKREHAFRDVRPFLDRSFFDKWRTKFESAIYNLKDIWGEVPKSWLEDESGIARSELTREEIEAQLIKPDHEIEGILPN